MDTQYHSNITDELIITRTINAPRERVWEAWTTPELLTCWYGPEGFTTPVVQHDVRVGGKYFYCMRSPDGQDYCSTGVFREVLAPERLVATDSFADQQGNIVSAAYYGMDPDFPRELLLTVTLEQRGRKTELTLVHSGMPAGESREQARLGWNESLDKLADCVE